MSKPVDLDRITVGGNTVDLREVEPSADYQELILTAISPKQEEVEVVYELRSSTPKDDLETLFADDYDVEPAGTAHKLVVSGNGVEVVYANARLEK